MGRAGVDMDVQRDINSLEDELGCILTRTGDHGGFSDFSVTFKRPAIMAAVEYRALLVKYLSRCREESAPDILLSIEDAPATEKLEGPIDIVITLSMK